MRLQKQTEASYELAGLECMKTAALTEELQITHDLDEDYIDKVIHVTIIQSAPEDEQVKVEWRKAS